MKHVSILIKPASSLCNLRCKYCFYHDVAVNRGITSYGIMDDSVAEEIIRRALDLASDSAAFMFQGGEPSLAGIGFFRNFIDCVNSNNQKKLKISYSIQTNGINITEEFSKFLHENRFLAGLSLDGMKEINDFMRGEDTFKKIMTTAALFEKNKVEYNILCVVPAYTARHIAKIYNFFKKSGFRYLQFIPCLDPLGEKPFGNPHSLTPELYESFLITLFRLWHDDFITDNYISVRFFDNLVRIYMGKPSEQCGMNGDCGGQLVIESDGSVYPCDFYCTDSWILGNISKSSLPDLMNSPAMIKFINTSHHNDEKCASCRYYYLCRGGCRRNRDLSADGTAGANIYCGALYNFYGFSEKYSE